MWFSCFFGVWCEIVVGDCCYVAGYFLGLSFGSLCFGLLMVYV